MNCHKLKALLVYRGISQVQLAERAGLSPTTINRWISGKTKPGAQTALIVANYLKVPLEVLIGDGELILR